MRIDRIQATLLVSVLVVVVCSCTPFPYRTWSEPRPATAPSSELGNWEHFFGELGRVAVGHRLADKLEEMTRNSNEPLDEATQERIEDARSYVLNHAECRKCLFWEQTLANIQALGRTIRISRSQVRGIRASYFFYTDMVGVRPEAVADHTTVQLAAILVHELTHRSWHMEQRERTRFTRDETLFLELLCDDYARREILANEIVAYRNQVAWTVSNIPSQSDRASSIAWLEGNDPYIQSSGYLWLLDSYLREGSGGRFARQDHEAWSAMDTFAKNFGIYLLADYKSKPLICGPPVIVRGPMRGQYENPVAYAPDIAVPFLCSNGFCP